MARNYTQGRFTPRNPKKYKGDPTKIFFRSSWELKMFRRLDMRSDVIAWASEEVVIPYYYPLDEKWHRYFMDIWCRVKKPNGEIKEMLIEIKPEAKKHPPKSQKRKTKKYLNEVAEYVKNKEKWKYADKYARKHGMSFHIFTEKQLGIHK